MLLTAYAQATARRDELHAWVGVFDAQPPPAPVFTVDGQILQPVRGALAPIRDAEVDANGLPLNHHGRFVLVPPTPGPWRLEVAAGAGVEPVRLRVDPLPTALPTWMDGSFNVLVSSCYFQKNDKEGLARVVATLPVGLRPQLVLLAGDQIYGDLPLNLMKERDAQEIRLDLGRKYRQNWTSEGESPGLRQVLAQAPVVCLPDDHEFWNNYPFVQAQIPDTHDPARRAAWAQAASELYQDYQVSEASAVGATRLDVGPLRMLLLDMRSERDAGFGQMLAPAAWPVFDQWVADLLAQGGAGVLSSGQALFIERPGPLDSRFKDAEMPNYEAQFKRLCEGLEQLAGAGIPVVYVTGDVHWGRIAQAIDLRHHRPLLYEVIASPSVLISGPWDFASRAKSWLFDRGNPWPRHAPAEKVPTDFGPHKLFWLEALQRSVVGDQVAVLSFAQAGGGVEFKVTYFGVSADTALARPQTFGPFGLKTL
ncbi:MAG: alkaline phosphatase D family protein [Pseudomonadota bacterium]